MESTAVTVKPELIDELLKSIQSPEDLFRPDGLFQRLKGALMERMLEAELTEHLGFEKNESGGARRKNSRNGYSVKTVETESGPVDIRIPRDRAGTFAPKLVAKHQRRLEGFDDKVLALYARGMSVREIQSHLQDLYGTEVSPELISRVTDSVIDELRAWQSRPLEEVYPILYLDAIFISVRDNGTVAKKAAYVAMGVTLDGRREVLGVWLQQSEGARFWLQVLTELKQRGVQDVIFVCCDGLTGFPQAVEAAYPKATVQTCIVHMIRNSLRYVGHKDRKPLVDLLRPIYGAPNEQAAQTALEQLEKAEAKRHPMIAKMWRARWNEVIPFLAFPNEIRKILYTTNCIESLNGQLRRAVRPKGAFPNDDAAMKVLYLAIQRAEVKWKRPAAWPEALVPFSLHFPGRLPV
jgi:putative transposase